jgi:hypothetical protein
MDEADLVITGHLTEALRNYLLDGGKVLWLAETDDAQQSQWGGYYGVHIGPRKGTPWSGDNEVHSGLFLGWIHKAVALIAERTVGRGKLLISTYRLCEHLSSHPVAAVLVRDMPAKLA